MWEEEKKTDFPPIMIDNGVSSSHSYCINSASSRGCLYTLLTFRSSLSSPILARRRHRVVVDGRRNRRRRLRMRYGPLLRRACVRTRAAITAGAYADVCGAAPGDTLTAHPTCRCCFRIYGRRNVSRLVMKQTYQAPTWRDASHDIPTAHAYVQLRAHRYRLRATERHKYVWDMNAWACTGRSKPPS